MDMSDEKYYEKIIDFYGPMGPRVGTETKTFDECIGFARKLIFGSDPYEDERLSYDNNTSEIQFTNTPTKLRFGDLIPYIYLKYNVLSLPPSMHDSFWETSIGRMVLSNPSYKFALKYRVGKNEI
jgi:hypothetical protein